MRKGYSVPLILMLVIVLVSVPLAFWISSNNFSVTSSNEEVRGASDDNRNQRKPGISVTVSSSVGVWDLVQSGCTSEEECYTSLSSGKRLATASGGLGANNTVSVYYDPMWDSYTFLKMYVRSGWGSTTVGYQIETLGEIEGLQKTSFTEDGITYDVVILPMSSLKSQYQTGPHFTR